MDLETYESLTGTSTSDRKRAQVLAAIQRSQSVLETLLGYTLDPDRVKQNLYNELGKTKAQLSCPSVDTGDLLPPDAVVGAYRLYDFNESDQFLAADPFSALNAVKLVHGQVTVMTFASGHYRPQVQRDGISKYIEVTYWPYLFDVLWFQRSYPLCTCGCQWQLAVDADWLWAPATDAPDAGSPIPDDLRYVLTDMVAYYANAKREVKSETLGSHSYSQALTVPQDRPENVAVIKSYAGPYGSVARVGVL